MSKLDLDNLGRVKTFSLVPEMPEAPHEEQIAMVINVPNPLFGKEKEIAFIKIAITSLLKFRKK